MYPRKVLLGLIHKGECKGMVAPALNVNLTEEELRAYVRSSYCMRCGELVPEADLEAEYGELP